LSVPLPVHIQYGTSLHYQRIMTRDKRKYACNCMVRLQYLNKDQDVRKDTVWIACVERIILNIIYYPMFGKQNHRTTNSSSTRYTNNEFITKQNTLYNRMQTHTNKQSPWLILDAISHVHTWGFHQ
jgi:hypothetical protein